MPTQRPIPIPFPLSSFPGESTQESAGRLVNCCAEPLGEGQPFTGPSTQRWRRQPGLSRHATTAQTGYRGGLIVNNLSYETWSGNASTVDTAGTVASLGSFPGTKKISIARNAKVVPDVVAVDIDNGAYVLSGGGAPAAYNGGGNLPQPNSVCFQDGYFFYTIADLRVFASPINSVGTINTQTFTTANSKSDVTLLRGIAFSGLLFLFTTGGLEVYQDTAQTAPAFPYTRLTILPYGLLQPNAIAGWETGFDDLMWVAQDFGVWRLPFASLQPQKISPPDLDRFIETTNRAGLALEASAYMFGGKKFWAIQATGGSWEFNLSTSKWNERASLGLTGLQGRWRAVGGHPAFGKWLTGDLYSGNLLFIDDTNFQDADAPQLFRMESGPVDDFPGQVRVARADFDFVFGVGQATGATANIVSPTVAISMSKDGGISWGNPLLRSLGRQQLAKRARASVKNMGLSGPMGVRWRIDISDPVYTSFMKGTQSADPRQVGG